MSFARWPESRLWHTGEVKHGGDEHQCRLCSLVAVDPSSSQPVLADMPPQCRRPRRCRPRRIRPHHGTGGTGALVGLLHPRPGRRGRTAPGPGTTAGGLGVPGRPGGRSSKRQPGRPSSAAGLVVLRPSPSGPAYKLWRVLGPFHARTRSGGRRRAARRHLWRARRNPDGDRRRAGLGHGR